MTETQDRSGDIIITGPESEAQLTAGATPNRTPGPYGLRHLDEGQRQFVMDLDALAVPVWVEHARTDGRGEFFRPRGWQEAWATHNRVRLGGFEPGMCLCANTGGRLIVVDVDPRNGGDIDAVRQWLTGLNVRVFADVITPSGGRHLYIDGAWREDIHTVHGKLPGRPGVDLQVKGANVFVPGTRRPKYDGKGYEIVVNDLAAIRSEGDPDGAANLAAWLAEHAPKRAASAPGQPWNGTPLDTRQRAYLDAVLTNSVREVAEAVEGTRNDTLNSAAFTLGAFVAGAGLDCGRAESALVDAADRCGLPSDEAETTVTSGMTAGMDNPRAVPDGEDQELHNPFGNRARRAAAKAATSASVSSEDAAASESEFWAQRNVLAQVLEFSRSRGVAPYAVLGAVLRRAITHVAPSVQLPPTVGDAVSVNLFTVSVGRSGQGKDAANGVGRAAVEFVTADGAVLDDPPSAVGLGSGEGLAKALRPTGDDDATPALVHLQVPEIGTLGALAERKGGTVIGELLKAYMGQPLGFTNAQATTTSYVPAHSYRLCLGIGAQPENANVFMEREKDGLPQRFLWLPTVDPYAPPPTAQVIEPVPAARVVLPSFPTAIPGTPHMVRTPAPVQEAIRMHRHRVLTGAPEVDPLDGHLMLTRLKVAFGLALLDTHAAITEDDWCIAGQLIEVSNQVRTNLQRTMADRRNRDNHSKAHAQADRQQIIDERQSEDRQSRVWKAIVSKLSKVQAATRRDLHRACDSTIARDFPAVFDSAVDQGDLVVSGGEGSAMTYRLNGS